MPTNYTPIVDGVDDVDATDINSRLTSLDTAIENQGNGSKSMASPTIASFANALHNHQNAAGGNKLEADLVLTATGDPNTKYLRPNGINGVEWADLPTAILTTKGDLLGRNASALARVPVGANDTYLVADSAQALGLKWGIFPVGPGVFSAYSTSDQVVTVGVYTKLTWDTEDFDPSGWFDLANERYTPLMAGQYLLTVRVSGGSGSNSTPFIYKNGVAVAGGSSSSQVTALLDMNGSTDYAEAFVLNAVAGNVAKINRAGGFYGVKIK